MRDRERLRRDREGIKERDLSLYGFIQEHWTTLEPVRKFVGGWAIKAVCDHLEAVTRGDIQYLLITIPPGMMKSLAVAVFWPAWEWGPMNKPSTRYLSSSYSDANVVRDNTKMRKLVESEKYQSLYGDRVQQTAKWGEHKFENAATGVREGRAFKSMTGGRGDRVLIDDPHSVDTAESDTVRADVVSTFREAIPDRLNDLETSSIVIIMQRLHADDVAGTIVKLGLPYVHLNLPMEYEREQHCITRRLDGSILFEDPRTKDGALLFPERFSRSRIEGLKTVKGSYAYAGQYQQRPTAREGGLFKRHYFAGKIISRDRVPHMGRRVRGWDFASKRLMPGKTPDATAGVRMARNGRDFYIEGCHWMQDTPGKVRDSVKSLAETDPRGTVIRIPQDPGQAGVDQAERFIEDLVGWTIKAVRPTGAKEVRAEPLAIQAEAGNVYIVNSGPPEEGLDPWIEPFIDELCAFPTGSLDDRVDAAADAFNELAPGSSKGFEAESAGTRDVIAEVERDSRYRNGDNEDDPGQGWGSVRSQNAGVY